MIGADSEVTAQDEERDDNPYLQHRADWHRQRAQEAKDDSSRILHLQFTRLYEARIQKRS
ncbi:hypothetical protein [Sphingomonas montana]|uniref:hypothetical protein n=1 Tax=Sphingomonas montana TaxID=1843236 RepID=UPI00101AEA0A|nr:hypothetical protein [Sphingomonas montana]